MRNRGFMRKARSAAARSTAAFCRYNQSIVFGSERSGGIRENVPLAASGNVMVGRHLPSPEPQQRRCGAAAVVVCSGAAELQKCAVRVSVKSFAVATLERICPHRQTGRGKVPVKPRHSAAVARWRVLV